MDTNKKPSLGDRYSDWAVIVVALVAVLLGWLLMSNVQSRSVAFDSGGVKGQMPAGWVTDLAEAGVVLHTTVLGGSGFSTAYQLEVVPVAGDASPADVASFYSINRAQNLNTVRVLDQQDVTVNGQNGYKVTYAFVDANSDLTRADVPVVVRGVDYFFVAGDHAVVVTYHANEDNYEADFGRFRRFLESLSY
jgi:uncharacterized integral membrane protein